MVLLPHELTAAKTAKAEEPVPEELSGVGGIRDALRDDVRRAGEGVFGKGRFNTSVREIIKTFPAFAYIRKKAEELAVEAEIFQSNYEGALVEKIQEAYGKMDGIVINPAAYTHTSIAILDALKAVQLPAAEVHLTDIAKREPFRQISYAGMACQAHFIGLGFEGYGKAMEWMKENCEKQV